MDTQEAAVVLIASQRTLSWYIQKSLSNTMMKTYNWLLDFDLIPVNLKALTKTQKTLHIKDNPSVSTMNKKDLIVMFFSKNSLLDCAVIYRMGAKLKSTAAHFASRLDVHITENIPNVTGNNPMKSFVLYPQNYFRLRTLGTY